MKPAQQASAPERKSAPARPEPAGAGMKPACVPGNRSEVHLIDAQLLQWQDTPEPGLRLKPVRYDDQRGHFLGLVNFAAMTRSGLHQHRGVATSFVIDGGLSDYHGPIGLHQAGINLRGATHDAMAFANTVLVSKLEGPVLYPPERERLSGLHAGSRHGEVRNPAPEMPPDFNVDVDRLTWFQTGVAGIRRQTIFDYAGTGSAHRFVQLSMKPGTVCPPWRAAGLTEFWVRGGSVLVNGQLARANFFMVAEAGAQVHLHAPDGALLLVWAEGAEQWLDEASSSGPLTVKSSLFGF